MSEVIQTGESVFIGYFENNDIEVLVTDTPEMQLSTLREDIQVEIAEEATYNTIILEDTSVNEIEVIPESNNVIEVAVTGTVLGYPSGISPVMHNLTLSGSLYFDPAINQAIQFTSGTRITENTIGMLAGDFYVGSFSAGNGNVHLGKAGAGVISVEHNFAVIGSSLFQGPVNFVDDLGTEVFFAGFTGNGWKLDANAGDYSLTVDNLTVRKAMKVYELIINQIRASNGSIWVSDAAKVYQINGTTCYIDTDGGHLYQPFVVDDIVRCQRWTGRGIKYYSARVTATDPAGAYFTLSIIDGTDTPEIGDDIVRIGNVSNVNRQGALYLTSSDDNAPYMDILDGVTGYSFAGKTKIRLGKLDGITDIDFGGALSGYGLYGQNVYLKGQIVISGGSGYSNLTDKPTSLSGINSTEGSKLSGIEAGATVGASWGSNLQNIPTTLATPAGIGLFLSASHMGYYDNGTWRTYIDNVGNFLLGNIAGGGAGISWNQATGNLNIKGTVTVSYNDITDKPVIGGRNLILGSAFKSLDNFEPATNVAIDTNNKNQGNNSVSSLQSGLPADAWRGVYSEHISVEPGDTLTLTIWSYTDDLSSFDSLGANCEVMCFDGETRVFPNVFSKYITPTQQGVWQKFTATGVVPSNAVTVKVNPYVFRNGRLWFNCLKLEKGTVATDWTPAPEDTDIAISDIEIGGRNLILGSSTATVGIQWSNNGWEGSFVNYPNNPRTYKHTSNGGWHVAKYTLPSSYANKKIAISFWAMKVSSETTSNQINKLFLANQTGVNPFITDDFEIEGNTGTSDLPVADVWMYFKKSVILNADYQIGIGSMCAPEGSGLVTVWRIKDLKVEAGNRATDWTPAPEDVEGAISDTHTIIDNITVGGRNLVRNSFINRDTDAYGEAGLTRSVNLEAGQQYVFSANGNSANGANGHYLEIYIYKGDWSWSSTLTIQETVNTTKSRIITPPTTGEYNISAYYYPNYPSPVGSVHVNWYKVEKGNKATDYTPAPEDYDDRARHFTSQPVPPYTAGLDTWTNGSHLYVCAVTRAVGESYVGGDFVLATGYDNTVTTINGGIVTSGTIQLAGDDQNIKAGITGVGTTDTDIRIWAGNTFANRASAPFRVDQAGSVVMTKAQVQSSSTGKRIVIDSTNNCLQFYNSSNIKVIDIDENDALPTITFQDYLGRQLKLGMTRFVFYPDPQDTTVFGINISPDTGVIKCRGVHSSAITRIVNYPQTLTSGGVYTSSNTSGSTGTIYLPSAASIISFYGLDSSDDYAVRLTIWSTSTSTSNILVSKQDTNMYFYNQNGDSITSVTLGTGDCLEVIGYKSSANISWQVININT